MKDLTKIKTPFGLLKPKVQKALETHVGILQHWQAGYGWRDWAFGLDGWSDSFVIRVKPADPKPIKPADLPPSTTPIGIFAAVKEWQEALVNAEGHRTGSARGLIYTASIKALRNIKVPE